MFNQIITISIINLFFFNLALAANELNLVKEKELNLFQTASQLFVNLKNESPLIIETNKIQTSEALGGETKQKGKFYFQDQKFRWEVKEPNSAFVVFDGNYVWSVQSPPSGFEGPRQVLKTKVNKKFNDQLLVMNLLGGEHLKKAFTHEKTILMSSDYAIHVKPIQKSQDLKSLVIYLNKDKSEIKKISFTDEIGNLTDVEFTKIKKNVSLKQRVFQFKAEKSDQISEL